MILDLSETPTYNPQLHFLLHGELQYFGYLMQRADPLEKTLMLGKIEGKRRRVRQRFLRHTINTQCKLIEEEG